MSAALSMVALLTLHAFNQSDSASLLGGWPSVDAWMVELRVEVVDYNDEKGAGVPQRRDYRRFVMAAMAPDRYYHYVSHYFEGDSWERDPRDQESIIMGRSSVHLQRFNRLLTHSAINDGDPLPGSLPHDNFFGIMPVWPVTDIECPRPIYRQHRYVLQDAIESGLYKDTGRAVQVSGEPGREVVSLDGNDRIVVSARHGGCVLLREIFDASNSSVLSRLSADRVGEVAPGLCIPLEFTHKRFGRGSGTLEYELKETIVMFTTDSGRIAQLFDKDPIRPGTIENMPEKTFQQISAGGHDLLDDVVNYLRIEAGQPRSVIRNDWLCVIHTSCAFGVGIFLAVVLARKKAATV